MPTPTASHTASHTVRSVLAAVGLIASIHQAALADDRPTTPAAPAPRDANDAKAAIDRAVDLLAANKPVQAKSVLMPLTSPEAQVGLSDADRARVLQLLGAANTRVKSLNPMEVSLQTAEGALQNDELRLAERHAKAVIDAPTAINAQADRARQVLASVKTRRDALAPTASRSLADAVADFNAGRIAQAKSALSRLEASGVPLSPDDADTLFEHQARIVDLETTRAQVMKDSGSALGDQGGIVRQRNQPPTPEPQPAPQPEAQTQPEAQPVPQPAPAATEEMIQAAMRAQAQSELADADLAFEKNQFNDAEARYNRLRTQFRQYLSAEQTQHVESRIQEARIRMGGNPGQGARDLERVIASRDIIRQKTLAEFDNLMQQARAAKDTGDVQQALNQVASALITLNSGRDVLSQSEYESRLAQQKNLLAEIRHHEEELRAAQTEKRTEELARQRAEAAANQAQTKERKITENIQRVRDLQKEMKYEEALQVTNQILFLDPINPTGLLLRDVISDAIIFRGYRAHQRSKIHGIVNQNDANADALTAPPEIVNYPSEWPAISNRRGSPIAFVDSEENRRTLAMLNSKRMRFDFDENSFADVVNFVQTVTQLNVDADWQSLSSVGVEKEKPVTLHLSQVSVKTALDRIVERVSSDPTSGAGWAVNDGVLVIASKETLNKNKFPVIYDIRDLLIEVPNYTSAPEFDLQQALQSRTGGGGGGQSPFRETGGGQNQLVTRPLQERTDELIRIVTQNVDQPGWQENGGDVGFIQQYQGNLIITQTPTNHRSIHGLLSTLREKRAMQINVESRFLLVSTDFFEQIGVDVDVYFNGKSNTVRAARAVRPTTRPSDFFDQQGRFDVNYPPSGSAGAGNLRSPLASPLSPVSAQQNSLGITQSLVGGDFAGNLVSQSALGVGGQFLDDIQVDFFVKATQADRRTVTLTAPRLTFTNGQIANILVATQTAYIARLNPVVSESAVGFDAQPDVVSDGVRLLVEGTISADRRYVTLNVDSAVARIDGFQQSPVTAIAGGQLVSSASTQSFIQLPTVTVTRIQNTVTVPDQGTILMGGQRLITEQEIETGVPVLSKIPIINRLFTNRIESREESTLLILLKPSILIQNEEEDRAFPGIGENIRAGFGG